MEAVHFRLVRPGYLRSSLSTWINRVHPSSPLGSSGEEPGCSAAFAIVPNTDAVTVSIFSVGAQYLGYSAISMEASLPLKSGMSLPWKSSINVRATPATRASKSLLIPSQRMLAQQTTLSRQQYSLECTVRLGE
jgi:hypothetical protein